MRVCILFRPGTRPEAKASLITIREELESTVYLGCLTDAGGNVLDWLEIRIQKPDCLLRDWHAGESLLTNRALDERWVEAVRFAREHDPGQLIVTGWEDSPPPPLCIDVATATPWHPTDPRTGAGWVACRDDRVLQDAGLPPYSSSTTRFLYLPESDAPKRFVAVSPGSPASAATLAPEEVFGDPACRLPVNPWGGFIVVRRFLPTTLREYVEVLNGKPWREVARHADLLPATLPGNVLMDAASRSLDQGRLFVGHHSLGARLLETLYLKVLVFQSVLGAVRDVTESLGRPLLNLTDESFRIGFGTDFSEVPFLWTARAVLTEAGTAVALQIAGGESAFVNLSPTAAVPYSPIAARAPFVGSGSVRVRRVAVQADGVVLEGTLAVTGATLEICASDVLRFRLSEGGRSLDLWARADDQAALAEMEYRFTTYLIPAVGEARQALAALEGVRFPRVPFHVIPCLSTPCDLYSTGVLACRIMLQSPTATLAEVLDEVQGLSHQIGQEEGHESTGAKVQRIFAREPRWAEVLGPQVLASAAAAPVAAQEAVPPELWFDLLGAVARLFPEMGPHSICKTFSDAPADGLHRVYGTALADFRDLTARLRSILLNDFRFNREVRTVIRDVLAASGRT